MIIGVYTSWEFSCGSTSAGPCRGRPEIINVARAGDQVPYLRALRDSLGLALVAVVSIEDTQVGQVGTTGVVCDGLGAVDGISHTRNASRFPVHPATTVNMIVPLRPCFFAGAFALISAGACSEPLVGNKCRPSFATDSSQTAISSPAFDCTERICLETPLPVGHKLPENSEHTPQCTAMCESDDECVGHDATTCQSGFACFVPTAVGRFCCQPMCVCRDFLDRETHNPTVPAACDPNDANNTCCNLPGRARCTL